MKTTEIVRQTYNVCVIGSGPAGMIFALEYARLNPAHKVLIIEYGRRDAGAKNQLDDSIKIENPQYHHGPYECTNKGLGGTSATWGGRCVMWDEVDFIDRPLLRGGCTWDIDMYNEIQHYLPAAANYFECGNPVFNLHDMQGYGNRRIADNFKEGIVTDSTLERWSMPTRFGKRYLKDLLELENVTLLEGFEARDFAEPDEDGTTRFLQVREVATKHLYTIESDAFIIAAGGQETTRILLRNLQLFKNLPAVPPALGKYYQGHLSGKIASVVFSGNAKNTDFGFIRDSDGVYVRRRFQFASNFLVNQNLLNTAIWLDNPRYHEPDHKNGPMSFMYLAMITPILGKKLAPPAIANTITRGKRSNVTRHLLNVVKGLPQSLSTPATIFYKRYMLERKLPGIFLHNPENCYALHFHAEQIPDESNRMELGPDGETLVIHYAPVQDDIDSVIKLHEVLDEWLRKCGAGELRYWYDKKDLASQVKLMSKDGVHQSGTTRMADSPEKGVVDRNLAVWGTSNIYTCSSSVFPTSGQANPTFLLGAFAVRLASHLTSKAARAKRKSMAASAAL